MFEEKYTLSFDDYEMNIMINSLNDFRTNLKEEERPTDAVDELLLKTAKAKKKKFRVSEERESYGQR